jgi:hypothetical protein
MAKAPLPGAVKTRLVPPLRSDDAAALGASFLRDVTENVALAARDEPIHGYFAYAPPGARRCSTACWRRARASCWPMARGFRRRASTALGDACLYLQAPEVTRRNTRIHFIQPLKERIVREVGYGLSLEGASSADLVKSKRSKS